MVDWDNDGDLDVIVHGGSGMHLFELRSGVYVESTPNPFETVVKAFPCQPAVVDWNGDGLLDLLLGPPTGGIVYYVRTGGELQAVAGPNSPFQGIGVEDGCHSLAVADLDGDGDLDLITGHADMGLHYFRQTTDGRLRAEGFPLGEVFGDRAVLADWDGDGRIDILLTIDIAEIMLRGQQLLLNSLSCCPVRMYLQKQAGRFTQVDSLQGPLLPGMGCLHFGCSAFSLVDVDGDDDLDAVFGEGEGELHFFEHKVLKPLQVHYLAEPEKRSELVPLDMVQPQHRTEYSSAHLASIDNLGGALSGGLGSGWRSGPGSVTRFQVSVDYVSVQGLLWSFLCFLCLVNVCVGFPRVNPNQPQLSRFFEHESNGMVRELLAAPLSNSACPIDWRQRVSVADFDGDGKLDFIGFADVGFVEVLKENFWLPVVCVQRSAEFVPVAVAESPFSSELFYWTGSPSFVDWDGDGDIDFLRIDEDSRGLFLKEQLSDGSWASQRLPVPTCRGFAAADFDRDGDVDLLISAENNEHCRYFERRLDGSLTELVGLDNPFDAACRPLGTSSMFSSMHMQAALGDWDGDGEVDMLRVGPEEVVLWLNRPMDAFMEPEYVFPEDDSISDVSLVDVDRDGDLDLVRMRQGVSTSEFTYFKQTEEGTFVEHDGANPFAGVPDKPEGPHARSVETSMTTVADVDGDGDLDVVYSNLEYAQQQADGQFILMKAQDNPFRGLPIENPDTFGPCWMLVDWDRDGDLDLVMAYTNWSLNTAGEILEYIQDGGVAAMAAHVGVQVRLYMQENSSFTEVTGAESPFYGMQGLPLYPSCPAMSDLDNDGDLDLLLVNMYGSLLYYEQHESQFHLSLSSHFSDVRLQSANPDRPPHIWLTDWEGDGVMDLVVRTRAEMQLFRRGACTPHAPQSFCMFGSCNQKTSECMCSPGAVGGECSLCDMYYFRAKDACQRCPGHGTLAGTCSRRGVCQDDLDARKRMALQNRTGFQLLAARGQ